MQRISKPGSEQRRNDYFRWLQTSRSSDVKVYDRDGNLLRVESRWKREKPTKYNQRHVPRWNGKQKG